MKTKLRSKLKKAIRKACDAEDYYFESKADWDGVLIPLMTGRNYLETAKYFLGDAPDTKAAKSKEIHEAVHICSSILNADVGRLMANYGMDQKLLEAVMKAMGPLIKQVNDEYNVQVKEYIRKRNEENETT